MCCLAQCKADDLNKLNKIVAKLSELHYNESFLLCTLKTSFVFLLFYIVDVFCVCVQDTEEALMMNLRDSHILNHKHNLEWNWLLIATILKVRLFSCSTTELVVTFSPPV